MNYDELLAGAINKVPKIEYAIDHKVITMKADCCYKMHIKNRFILQFMFQRDFSYVMVDYWFGKNLDLTSKGSTEWDVDQEQEFRKIMGELMEEAGIAPKHPFGNPVDPKTSRESLSFNRHMTILPGDKLWELDANETVDFLRAMEVECECTIERIYP
jgi:hypothetical protein